MPLVLRFFVHASKGRRVVTQTQYNFLQESFGDGTLSVPTEGMFGTALPLTSMALIIQYSKLTKDQ